MRMQSLASMLTTAWLASMLHPATGQEAVPRTSTTTELAYVRPAELASDNSAEVIRVVPITDDMREAYDLDEFYQKVSEIDRIPIVASAKVSDYALLECAWVIDHMLAGCDEIKAALVDNKVRVGIIAAIEYTMDIPENQNPRMLARAAYHDRRSRGLGGARYTTCGEENLLSLRGDPYFAENIAIHEFAHTIASNLRRVDRAWWNRLVDLYQRAMDEGLWVDTYAATNVQEYWAEATQSWFDCNNRRADGRVHNGIWNRDKLKQYDPRLAAFLTETFGDRTWRYSKTIDRADEELAHLAGLDREQMPTFSFENSPRVQADPNRAPRRSGRRQRSSNRSTTDSASQTQSRAAVDSAAQSSVRAGEILSVPDVMVETIVGHLPRLPLLIPAIYRDGAEGPDVRVIWPAPEDNEQVLEAGNYTVIGTIPGTDFKPRASVTVAPTSDTPINAPKRSLEAFFLRQVVLNKDEQGRETPLIRNRDKFVYGLAETNPDSFLYMFRDAFGQAQPEGARPLGGWDSQTTRLRGHASGHYLSAMAQAYAGTTYDEQLRDNFKRKMDYLIETLHDLSQMSGKPSEQGGPFNADPAAVPPGPGKDGYNSDLSVEGIRTDYWNWGRGFISAYPPDQFIMLEQGAGYGGSNHQIWAPYYTLHKILAGLLDCYEVGENEKALEVARDMGLWVYERLRQVPTETRVRMWNRYIAGEYGGMNEVMARLYRLTDDKRFLEGAQLFDNIDFFFGNAERSHGLARNVDTIRGKHANQHIPQITGALETYRCTLDPQYYLVANNFWHLCTGSYMYAIGGVAGASRPNNAECFTAQPDSLYANGFARGGQNETCATYNLLKLSRQLFMYEPNAEYMDYYEQALYNHILASVDEDGPGNTYHVPLNPGSRKRFGNASMRGFSCCNGTALESHTKLQDSIYFKSADNEILFVNLFVPSTLHWSDRDVVVTQETSFPYSDRTRLTIDGEGDFDVRVRVPHWASRGMHVSINGKEASVDTTPGKYLTLSRVWKKGDTIELRIPFSFRLSRVMDQPKIASIFYGPVLLAVEESSRLSAWRRVSLNADDLSQSIAGDPSTLSFQIGDLRLKPFFETYGRYSVYMDVTLE